MYLHSLRRNQLVEMHNHALSVHDPFISACFSSDTFPNTKNNLHRFRRGVAANRELPSKDVDLRSEVAFINHTWT